MAHADGMIVFLDLDGDRYFALPRALSGHLAEELKRGALTDEVVAGLRAAGVVASGEGRPLAFEASPEPVRDIAPARTSLLCLPHAALCRWRAAMLLRRRHISAVVDTRRNRRRGGAASDERIVATAATFAGSRPLTNARNACLRETLALLLYLGPAGAAVDWVFAVKGAPFAAHCWAQLGDRVLNDSADHARAYRPIMVV